MVGAEVGGGLEPVAGGLGQHLALERDRRQHLVEGAEPVAGDDHPAAVRQVVVVAHLAAIMVGQLGDGRLGQDLAGALGEGGDVHGGAPLRLML